MHIFHPSRWFVLARGASARALLTYLTLLLAAMLLPLVAKASLATEASLGDGEGELGTVLANILSVINTVLIPFLLGVGFLVFVWGMFQYFVYGGDSDDARTKGKSLMAYAVLGFVLIIIFWGIVNLLAASTGLVLTKGEQNTVNNNLLPQVNEF